MVESLVPNEVVVGSSPITRSMQYLRCLPLFLSPIHLEVGADCNPASVRFDSERALQSTYENALA